MEKMGEEGRKSDGGGRLGDAAERLAEGRITDRILGAAVEVHRRLGPGFLEAIYEEALSFEMEHRGIRFQRQVAIPILYLDRAVGRHRLDLLVEDTIIVELKATVALEDIHHAVLRSYLRAAGKTHGLLLNFSQAILQVKRVRHD